MKYIMINNRIISIADILTVRYEERMKTMIICLKGDISFCIDGVNLDEFIRLFNVLNGRSDE